MPVPLNFCFNLHRSINRCLNFRYSQYTNELVCPMVPDIEWIETLVTLVRQDTGFGFRIVGGTEEGSQVSGRIANALD